MSTKHVTQEPTGSHEVSRREALSRTIKATTGILVGSTAALGLTHKPQPSPLRLALQRARLHAAERNRISNLPDLHPEQAKKWKTQRELDAALMPVIQQFMALADQVDNELADVPWEEKQWIYWTLADELRERLWQGSEG